MQAAHDLLFVEDFQRVDLLFAFSDHVDIVVQIGGQHFESSSVKLLVDGPRKTMTSDRIRKQTKLTLTEQQLISFENTKWQATKKSREVNNNNKSKTVLMIRYHTYDTDKRRIMSFDIVSNLLYTKICQTIIISPVLNFDCVLLFEGTILQYCGPYPYAYVMIVSRFDVTRSHVDCSRATPSSHL